MTAPAPSTTALAPRAEVRSIVGHVRLSLPRAGKIRLGIRTDRGYPKEVDYFVLDADLPGRAEIVRLYGAQPKRLLVTLVSSDPEEVFPHALKAYGKGLGLLCRGDGRTALRARVEQRTDRDGKAHQVIVRDQAGRPLTEERACPCDWLKAKKCRALGNLVVVLPEVGLGVYQLDTSSWWSMQNVRSDLAFLNSMLAARGGVRGMLLWLERVPKTTHGSGREETHYPLRLSLPTPEEYAARAAGVGKFIARYQSVLGSAPALDAGPSPSAAPYGSPPEEDLHRDEDLVDPAAAEASAPDVGDGGGDDEPDADVDPDEAVGGAPIEPQPELADEPLDDEDRAALTDAWGRLESAVIAARINASAPSPKHAAAKFAADQCRFDIAEFGRSLKSGKVSKARAREVVALLARAASAANGSPSEPVAAPAPKPAPVEAPKATTAPAAAADPYRPTSGMTPDQVKAFDKHLDDIGL